MDIGVMTGPEPVGSLIGETNTVNQPNDIAHEPESCKNAVA